jgi:hypothetical protein
MESDCTCDKLRRSLSASFTTLSSSAPLMLRITVGRNYAQDSDHDDHFDHVKPAVERIPGDHASNPHASSDNAQPRWKGALPGDNAIRIVMFDSGGRINARWSK